MSDSPLKLFQDISLSEEGVFSYIKRDGTITFQTIIQNTSPDNKFIIQEVTLDGIPIDVGKLELSKAVLDPGEYCTLKTVVDEYDFGDETIIKIAGLSLAGSEF